MKLYLSLTLMLLLCVTKAYGMLNFKKILMMYAYRLVDELCLGKRITSQWMYEEHYAMSVCKAEVHEQFRDIVNQVPTTPGTTTTPSSFGGFDSNNLNNEEFVEAYDSNRIKTLDDNHKLMNAMFNCTLRMLNITTEDMDLNRGFLNQKYQNLRNIDSDLQIDLTTGVQDCIGIANCLPAVDHSGLDPKIKRALIYSMCDKKRKALACIKHDLKSKTMAFNSEALDGIESLKFNQNSKNSDKILALLFSEAHDPEDYIEIISL